MAGASIAGMSAWITPDGVRTRLGLPAGTPSDSRLTALIAEEQAAVERAIAQAVELIDVDELLDSDGTDTLFLTHRPVVGDVTLTLASTGEEIDPSVYKVDRQAGLLIHKTGTWAAGLEVYSVEHEAGYEAVPEDLIGLLCELVALDVNGKPGVQSETIGDHSKTLASRSEALSASAKATLARWQRPPEIP